MSQPASQQQASPSQPPLDPSARMKKLVAMSHEVSVDKNVPIARYFHSCRELIKAAASFKQNGDIEKAFVLYLRYMTLVLEKILLHPEYATADKNEKALIKRECYSVFDLAEDLKKRILEKYTAEFEAHKLAHDASAIPEPSLAKRSIHPESSAPPNSHIDEIDRKFDFSRQPGEIGSSHEAFDPFNIEELRRCLDGM